MWFELQKPITFQKSHNSGIFLLLIELKKNMNISEVITATKVGEIVKVDYDKKKWEISWIEDNKDILSDTSGRVYIITSNGVIKKIGGSQDKGGIKGTFNWYENNALSGGPSVRTYGIHILIREELDKGNSVEIYMILSQKIKTAVKGLFKEEIVETNVDFKTMENMCKNDYISIVSSHPEWNFQERGDKWPIYIREGCNLINTTSTKKSKSKKL